MVELAIGYENILLLGHPADMGLLRSLKGPFKQLSVYKPHLDPAFQCRLVTALLNREEITSSGGPPVPMKRGGHGHTGDARDQDSLTIMWAHGAWVALRERAKGLVGRRCFLPMQ